MNNETKSKPFILTVHEAEKELIDLINKFMQVDNIPCYFLETVVDKIYSQIKAGARAELAQAEKAYYTPKTENDNSNMKIN